MTENEARKFLSSAAIRGAKIDYVEIDEGRRITFADCSADDAILAAEIIGDLLAEIEKREGRSQ